MFARDLGHLTVAGIRVEYGAFGRAVGQQGFDDLAMGVAVVNLHGQAQFLGQGNMRAESLALQFLGTFAGAEQVHAGLADSAVALVGMPEARIILAEATIAVATAPKSNASYNAINQALADVDTGKIGAVPLYLRNAPTKLMKEWGNHEGYKYAHDWPGAVAPQEYMPEELRGTEYYHPNDRGYEHEVSQRLAKIRPILHGGEPEQK